MNMLIFKEISRLIPIFLLVLAVAIGARFVANRGVDQTVQNYANITSVSWAKTVAKNIPNIKEIIAGSNR